MRHLRSILYALVLAPAVWILSGVGFTHDLTGRARDYGGVETFTGLLLLLLAGTAYAILLLSPISPAGPALFGMIFLGVGVWALASPSSYGDAWPASVAKDGFDLSLPGYGLAALLAVPLIGTALSSRRWERYEPPQIPLIGVLGRPHGAAAVAGSTPIASVTTEIFTRPMGLKQTAHDADPTQLIKLPGGTVKRPGPAAPSAAPAAAVAAASEASDETTVLPIGGDPDATQVTDPDKTVATPSAESVGEPVGADVDEARTELVRLGAGPDATQIVVPDDDEPVTETAAMAPASSEADAIPPDDDDRPATEVAATKSEETATEALRPEDDEPKSEVVAPAPVSHVGEDATEAVPQDSHAAEAISQRDDDLTEAAVTDADEPKTEVVSLAAAAEESDEAEADVPTEAAQAETPTEAVLAEARTEAAHTEEPTEAAPTDEPAEATPVDEPAEAAATAGSEEPAAATSSADDEDATVAAAPAEDEAAEAVKEPILVARSALDEDDQDKTQVIKLRASEMITRDLGRRYQRMPDTDNHPTHAIDRTAMTQSDSPGERTQIIPINRGEDTQVIRLPQQHPQPTEPERTSSARMQRGQPSRTNPFEDGERTQVIRLGSGTVEPPGERTQVIRLPVQPPPGESEPETSVQGTQPSSREPEDAEPPSPPSILAAERPDPGSDPTTWLRRPSAGAENEATPNGKKRIMTVTNLERPADEAADDTRRLVTPPIPTPRRPNDEQPESQ